MKTPRFSLRTYIIALAIFALTLATAGYDTADRSSIAILLPADGAQVLPDLSGSWAGTWEDTLYFVDGGLTCTITVDGNTWSAVGQIDLTALGIGWQDGTATGTLDGNELTFTFTAAMVGNGGGAVNPTNGSGTGTVTAPLDFGSFTFTGTVSASEIAGTFDFDSIGGGEGVVSLSPGVANEALSWGDVKDRFQ